MMNKLLKYSLSVIIVCLAFAGQSCSDRESYAEQLSDENKNVNRFLSNHKVIDHVPNDTVFEIGVDAPYYALDNEGNIYMQVINPGSGPKAEKNQEIYFRYMRYMIEYYGDSEEEITGDGNGDMVTNGTASLRFENYVLPSSRQWGEGLQMPLRFLPLNCEVNLIVKSQYGIVSETGYVKPYLYRIRYYKSQI